MGNLLNEINNYEDIKKLNYDELEKLVKELRREIISVVSKNGGHLASNLGVIELTIALLREFDLPDDKIVWDVGHQTYAYKILTGRREAFQSLRKIDGLSGFPKKCESIFDCFNTGHSSTSISAALGILRGNLLNGVDHRVIAVIGDGALTGGMSFEALNDGGQSDADLIVILNDNEMSISENVGGISRHLSHLRLSKKYINLKGKTSKFLSKTKIGRFIAKILELYKYALRYLIKPEKVFFDDLGFRYYGPVDGHDIKELEHHLAAVKALKGPVLLHVLTTKGKGYEFAENRPDIYHGVAPFEISNGMTINPASDSSGVKSFTDVFSNTIVNLAEHDKSIAAICAAMQSGTGLSRFKEHFPERFFDVGIAEQHALTMAAGMACSGIKPVVAIYSTFLQRGYDQLIHDIALQKLHVVLAIDRGGLVGEDGETHQGIFDIAMLRTIPEFIILSPGSYKDLEYMLNYALYSVDSPIAIRYPRGKEPQYKYPDLIDEYNDKNTSDSTNAHGSINERDNINAHNNINAHDSTNDKNTTQSYEIVDDKTGDDKTVDCKTGDYKTVDDKTVDCKTGNYQTVDDKTVDCKTGNYKTVDDKTVNYKTEDYQTLYFQTDDKSDNELPEFGKPAAEVIKSRILSEGQDITVITEGIMWGQAFAALDILAEEKKDISVEVIDIRSIRPLDEEGIIKSVNKTGVLLSIENGTVVGGLGTALEELLYEKDIFIPFKKLGISQRPPSQGKVTDLFEREGIDPKSIALEIENLLSKK